MIKKTVLASTIAVLMFGSVAQASVAQIVSLNGKAVVERANHKYTAQRGMVLEEGDIVRSLNGNVKLKYANCVGSVEAAQEVEVSQASPCATAKAAKASDLKDVVTKNYKIQRIDSNLAEATCTSCKVDLASAPVAAAGLGNLLPGLAAGAAGIAGAAASKSSGATAVSNAPVPAGNSDDPVSPQG